MAKVAPALVVGLAGIGVALVWFYVWEPLALIIFLLPIMIGLLANYMVDSHLADDDPVGATKWMYAWGVMPFSLAVAGAAAAIIIAVALDPGKEPSVERKEIFSAAAAALGAFVVAAFVKDAEEADEKWLGARFKRKFQQQFRGRFPQSSRGEQAVEQDSVFGFSGWGREARQRRAEKRRSRGGLGSRFLSNSRVTRPKSRLRPGRLDHPRWV